MLPSPTRGDEGSVSSTGGGAVHRIGAQPRRALVIDLARGAFRPSRPGTLAVGSCLAAVRVPNRPTAEDVTRVVLHVALVVATTLLGLAFVDLVSCLQFVFSLVPQ